MTKIIIILWTLLCAWVLYEATADAPDVEIAPIFLMQLVMWGAGVMPVALIGLLFRRSRKEII